jgi:predicted O-methyltransferase YrrM
MTDQDYNFTSDWFSFNIPNWKRLFDDEVGSKPRILEIGSHEGRSACWIIERLAGCHGGGELVCVDLWSPDEVNEDGEPANSESLFADNLAIAIERFPSVNVRTIKGDSVEVLCSLLANNDALFDLIYVDGDHRAKGALGDLLLANRLCKQDGIIIVDDYLWRQSDPPHTTPKLGVDAFVNIFFDEVIPLRGYSLYQLFLKKTAANTAGRPSSANWLRSRV